MKHCYEITLAHIKEKCCSLSCVKTSHVNLSQKLKEQQFLACVLAKLNPDEKYECKSAFVSLLLPTGRSVISIGGKKLVTNRGNLLLIRDECTFTVAENDADLFIVVFRKDIFDHMVITNILDCPLIYDFLSLKRAKDEYLFFEWLEEQDMLSGLSALINEIAESDKYSSKTVKCALIIFLTQLHRIHRPALIVSESSMMKDYPIGNIIKYMVDNYATVTLKSVAEEFNYNPTYFSTFFSQKAYCSFTKKLQEIRMEQAQRLLITTKVPIYKICELIGFEEKSYFYKSFKKKYGMTPSQFRKKHGQA